MTERRVRFTATASLHVDRERTWWLANRDHQDLFALEIEDAVHTLALLPGAGACGGSTFASWPATCTTRLVTRKWSSERCGVPAENTGLSSEQDRPIKNLPA